VDQPATTETNTTNCKRSTEGASCPPNIECGPYGNCQGCTGTCATSGSSYHECRDYNCHNGSCLPGSWFQGATVESCTCTPECGPNSPNGQTEWNCGSGKDDCKNISPCCLMYTPCDLSTCTWAASGCNEACQ
jgi:hypothetical protein